MNVERSAPIVGSQRSEVRSQPDCQSSLFSRLSSGLRQGFCGQADVPPSPRLLRAGRRPASVRSLTSGLWPLTPGFTLVELLVVIVVISILAGITFPLSRYAIRRANEARQTVMRAKIHSALEDYRAVYGEYPITPPAPSADVLRHYPAVYDTHDKISSSTNVNFGGTNLTETIYDVNETALPAIDYSLTYPLMLKQLEKGARPFMEFPIVDVVFLVVEGGAENEIQWSVWRRMKGGGKMSVLLTGIYGDAVQRPKAIDPVSGSNWVYVCTNGLNYKLTP